MNPDRLTQGSRNLMTVSTTLAPVAATDIATSDWNRHPFVTGLARYLTLSRDDRDSLRRLIEAELTIEKRRDLVIDGYAFHKLCFVAEGFGARYKLLRNGKRQILNVILPGDMIGVPV